MAYTKIPDQNLAPDKPGRSVDALALRDNPLAIGNNFQVFTASGTLVITDQLADTGFIILCQGGGGTGIQGPDVLTSGAGGGGGGCAMKRVLPGEVSVGNNVAVTVGGSGQASSVAGFCTGAAGANGGAGGSGTDDGGAGSFVAFDGSDGNKSPDGTGGSAHLGGGSRTVGRNYGGGGGGVNSQTTPFAGGPGVVIILY